MRVNLLSTGRELLEGRVQEANAFRAAGWLYERGFAVGHMAVAADGLEDLVPALRRGLDGADALVCSGGLGPTADDRTSPAAATLAGVELVTDRQILAQLRRRFADWGLPWTENQARQARFPAGARPIENPLGTAPGFELEISGRHLFCLPGPPVEFNAMFQGRVLGRLERLRRQGGADELFRSRLLRVFGRGEGWLQNALDGLEEAFAGLELGFRAAPAEVELVLRLQATEAAAAERMLDAAEREIRRRLGHHVFSSGPATLPQVLLERLQAAGRTLAVAESCTGGLIGKLLTDIPGASRSFLLSAVTYADTAKHAILGVGQDLLGAHGAVSAQCAEAMARGVRRRSGADMGLAVTGIAGPGGGSGQKPVGLVFFAVCDERGCRVHERRFPPRDRDFVRRLAAHAALWLVLRRLAG